MAEQFLGKPFVYWFELQKEIEKMGYPPAYDRLLLDNAKLRAQLACLKRAMEDIETLEDRYATGV